MSCNTDLKTWVSIQSEILTLEIYRLQRQATPPSPEEVDQQEEEVGQPRSPAVATPTPMSTPTPTPLSTSTQVPFLQLEKPSVQQLLAQPGFSSGVFIHTGPRHPQFASLASRCEMRNYKTQVPGSPIRVKLTKLIRLATFEEWPPGLSQRPQEMAEAGLIYLGREKSKASMENRDKHESRPEIMATYLQVCQTR